MSEQGRPRGLGRGLSALLGEQRAETGPAFAVDPAPILPPPAPSWSPPPLEFPTDPPPHARSDGGPKPIALNLIDRNPNQPRRHFDPIEMEELTQSIRAHGVLQPILLRPSPQDHNRFEIIAGERRWRAAQACGLAAIPALVRDYDGSDVMEVAIIENVQRTDLNPIEEAEGYQHLIKIFGHTQQDIAEKVGKSRPHIANMLRLLTLPENIQDMVRDGRLSAGHARAILTAPDPLALAKLAISQGLSVREIEKRAQRAKEGATITEIERQERDPDIVALQEKLQNALGVGVIILPKGEGAGEIKIAYKRLDQLDDICRRLSAG